MKLVQKAKYKPDKIDKYEGYVPGWRWCKTCNKYVLDKEVEEGKHGFDDFPTFLNHNIKTKKEMNEYRKLEVEKAWKQIEYCK